MVNAFERQAVRDAVKEASERAKHYRTARSIPKERWGNAEQLAYSDPDRDLAVKVERDAADIFVDVLTAALRRSGAWIVFLE